MATPGQSLHLSTVLRTLRRIPPTPQSSTSSTRLTLPSRRPTPTTFIPSTSLHTTARLAIRPPPKPPASAEDENAQKAHTFDFDRLDVLSSAPVPSTAIDICHADGFALNSGVRIDGGAGALLVGGEAFAWRPWDGAAKRLVNDKAQWEVSAEGLGVLGLVWPRPDLLILGLGPEMRPLSPATRRAISALGIRVEIADTRNAAAQYNLLATERGVDDVAAALIPIGWKEGVGAV
ncbi:hypothetical protein B0H67DRAFT_298463 [Lasiosphaeris hirsuta]|uniref:NADH dehydrogenase [ubiquinone] 1 alpha subcomplex assembly factor 3 n=1 Tax=Lasiosphaeris hirsuta TaxID=260670 RepID=A0AA40A9E2_9PEZI|nr:hypothetical protein B0H67DRAFT_298463 [Lasiosphaeris hirsuta]